MVSLDSTLLAQHIAGAKRLTVAGFTAEPLSAAVPNQPWKCPKLTAGNAMQLGLLASLVTQTRGDESENAHSGSPAVQLQFMESNPIISYIPLILMILGIMQVIQIMWYTLCTDIHMVS